MTLDGYTNDWWTYICYKGAAGYITDTGIALPTVDGVDSPDTKPAVTC